MKCFSRSVLVHNVFLSIAVSSVALLTSPASAEDLDSSCAQARFVEMAPSEINDHSATEETVRLWIPGPGILQLRSSMPEAKWRSLKCPGNPAVSLVDSAHGSLSLLVSGAGYQTFTGHGDLSFTFSASRADQAAWVETSIGNRLLGSVMTPFSASLPSHHQGMDKVSRASVSSPLDAILFDLWHGGLETDSGADVRLLWQPETVAEIQGGTKGRVYIWLRSGGTFEGTVQKSDEQTTDPDPGLTGDAENCVTGNPGPAEKSDEQSTDPDPGLADDNEACAGDDAQPTEKSDEQTTDPDPGLTADGIQVWTAELAVGADGPNLREFAAWVWLLQLASPELGSPELGSRVHLPAGLRLVSFGPHGFEGTVPGSI